MSEYLYGQPRIELVIERYEQYRDGEVDREIVAYCSIPADRPEEDIAEETVCTAVARALGVDAVHVQDGTSPTDILVWANGVYFLVYQPE
jgi:hypothetical protein